MKQIGFLLIALAFMMVLYALYRRYYIDKPKTKTPKHRPNFTLKIEP